jgi:hypothetical protein
MNINTVEIKQNVLLGNPIVHQAFQVFLLVNVTAITNH